MSIQLKLKFSTLIVIGSIAIGMIAGPALLRAMTVEAGNLTSTATAFVGGAIVNGQSDPQKITCSTGGAKHTNGLQFSAHTRMGTLHGYWDIASPFTGAENKGGYIHEGKTNGKTYELKGKETHDGICQTKVPKNIIITGNCGTNNQHKIHYETISGLNHVFSGTVKCLGHTTN
ncbi:MAG TPA: hypothetical protein VHH33_03645 [Nitrososphaeraceae archaeon]|jgi:hypothetical protein|nr:hypothetical protein [Nitrososphaeraceae archaeon]